MPDADLDLAVRASVFGAVGTCGQRCTSLRRLVRILTCVHASSLCSLVDFWGVCTQLVHESVYETVKSSLLAAYKSVPRGDPLVAGAVCSLLIAISPCYRGLCVLMCAGVFVGIAGTLQGPLHTKAAVKEYTDGLEEITKQGGSIIFGGKVVEGPGNFVEATVVEIDPSAPIVKTELFVPILYLMKFKVRL